jgi:hypothetical protein
MQRTLGFAVGALVFVACTQDFDAFLPTGTTTPVIPSESGADVTVDGPPVVIDAGSDAPAPIDAPADVTPDVHTPVCITSTRPWPRTSITPAKTGSFRVDFDVIPSAANHDCGFGVAKGDPKDDWHALAATVLLDPNGRFYARQGNRYWSENTIRYAAGTKYHVRMDIDVATHVYDVEITPAGQPAVKLANKYAFHTNAASIPDVDGWIVAASAGAASIQICDVSVQ